MRLRARHRHQRGSRRTRLGTSLLGEGARKNADTSAGSCAGAGVSDRSGLVPGAPPTGRAGEARVIARLLKENGTLYLVSPEYEQAELRPLFVALVQAVYRAAVDTSASCPA